MKMSVAWFAIALQIAVASAQPVFPVRDAGESPSRAFDVLHYRIEVSFDEGRRMVMGRTTITLIPFLDRMDTVQLDAEKLQVSSVTDARGTSLPFVAGATTLKIRLARPAVPSDTVRLTVTYTATPRRGLYFVQPDSAYPRTPWQIWTQGEDMDNHCWFPCYDYPNDVATVEVLATVRDRYVALSNGGLAGVKEDRRAHTRTYHWKLSKPIVSYLVMLAIGEYAVIKDRAGTVPVEYYVYPEQIDDAKVSFGETPDMIRYFGEKLGFPYPWEKYAQVLLHEFIEGGMENASATSLTDEGAVFTARERLDETATSLIAHELAHQWWGDVVTCKDWRHLWLNEGFASYFDPLYFEYRYGRDEFEVRLRENQQNAIRTDHSLGRKPIVSVGSHTNNVYSRGAVVLHMLRTLLGDRLFWKSLSLYITRHQFSPVETNDLKRAVEDATGQNLYWFFDQWVYRAGYPEFTVTSTYNDSAKAVRLSVAQTQKQDSLTGIFQVPLSVSVITASGSASTLVRLSGRDTTFSLPSPGKPLTVIFDEGNTVLKELHFRRPAEEWAYQAQHAGHAIDRILAIQDLATDTAASRAVEVFAAAAGGDPFYAVRREAVKALADKRVPPSAACESVLVAATADRNAAVRAAAASGLSRYTSAGVRSALRRCLEDSSYAVMASALSALARVDSAHALEWLPRYLTVPSRNEMIASTALGLISRADSATGVGLALERVRPGGSGRMRGQAMAILRRPLKTSPEVEQVFIGQLHDRMRWIRWSAVHALGESGGKASVKPLEAIAADPEDAVAAEARLAAEKITKRLTVHQ